MDKAIEAAARVIAPGRWAVMDSYLEQAKRQYAKSKGCILINTGADFEKWRNLEGSAFQDGAS